MPWPKSLQALWHRLLPTRYVLVYRDPAGNIPSGIGEDGQALGIDDMLPEIVDAYKTCAPMFAWLARELARLEKLYHEKKPDDPAALQAWQNRHGDLNREIAAITRALRAPQAANMRLKYLADLAAQKKISEAQRKALEEFFTE